MLGEWGFMQMTVTSEGLLRNSKYIKMGREEGGFLSFPHTATSCNCLPWVNHLAVIHLWFCIGLKCRCSISCQAKSVSTVAHFKPTYSLLIYNRHLLNWGALIPVSFSFFLCFFLYFSFLCRVMLCYLFCKFLQKLFYIYCYFYHHYLLLILLFN